MSWDADFNGQWWNYTHNTNRMLAAAYESVTGEQTEDCDHPLLGPAIGPTWYKRLDGMTAAESIAYLGQIIEGLRRDPDRYREMNPENGWGDYAGILRVLEAMRHAAVEAQREEPARCPECKADIRRWHVSG